MEQALFEARIPVLLVFEGWAGTSKVGTIGLLTRRLDPRGLRVHPVTPPRTSETQYPWLYRFWLKIPSYGQMALFDRSWYREVLAARTHEQLDANAWHDRCADIVSFERQLADDGALILKFWLHISKDEQKQRFKKLQADPVTAWQVTDEDVWQNRHYGRVCTAAEDMLTRTDSPWAPWLALAASDKRYTNLAVFETLLNALEARLGNVPSLRAVGSSVFDQAGPAMRRRREEQQSAGVRPIPALPSRLPTISLNGAEETQSLGILQRVDLSQRIADADYSKELARLQAKLYLLGLQVYYQKRPVVLVFEGWDAAGKGGAIKRVTEKLDPRAYVVHAIAAPAGEDKERHYLYRFWRRLPPKGQIAIFDRSWYGRVLVERVEGFARPAEWQRAYAEINEFEGQLVNFGTIFCKFWLHISPDEQLRRFEERQSVPHKAWKLTEEDWRNREKWPQYEAAADAMILHSSTPVAPWTVVEAEDKRFARIKVLRTVVQRLEDELGKVKL
jgi:polyphosphate kinase 2 (PPK2 family)